jgi:hypothetical protein
MRTLESFKNYLNGDVDKMIRDNLYTLIYITLLLLVTTIPAVLVAINCNKTQPVRYGMLAFLVSDIYLLQWSIKKFIMKYPDYCPI